MRATQVDTIVHTFLETNSTRHLGRSLHEINVIGTMNLLAAAGAPGTPVRQVVVKSSTLVYGASETGPGLVPGGDHRARRRYAPGWSARCSRSRPWSATSPRTIPN